MSISDLDRCLDKLIKKKFLSRYAKKKAKTRGEQISDILQVICKPRWEFKEEIDLPRQEFRGAVERYLSRVDASKQDYSTNSKTNPIFTTFKRNCKRFQKNF